MKIEFVDNAIAIHSKSPQLAEIPDEKSIRLIDNGMLHYEASISGLAERYSRGETSHTIHVWWARRPHSAMRALVYGALCKDQSPDSYETLKQISLSSTSTNNIFMEKARNDLISQYPEKPRVLDMFGGGGTIPFEASNLGAETYTIDSNELSVFIQKCNLIYSQCINKDLNISKIIEISGTRVLNQLSNETESLYPLRKDNVIGYFWTYSMTCSECNYKFYLSKRPWLSKKKGRNLGINLINTENEQRPKIQDIPEGQKPETVWQGRNGIVKCPKCNHSHKEINVKKCNDELVALVKLGASSGKEFIEVPENALPNLEFLKTYEISVLNELKIELPNSKLPLWSGIVNPAIYGIETHSDFINPRQRVVLLVLIRALVNEYHYLKNSYEDNLAKYVVSLLSSLIDQLVDWNCRLSMWISQNEQVGRAFCGPGVPMLWDYVETDPVLKGPANLWSKLKRIIEGARSIRFLPGKANVQHAFAQSLPYENNFFDAIVTDPPYYDNVYYTVLADFFYSWKRFLLKNIEPDLFKSEETNSSKELVASTFRTHSPEKAHEDYCHELTLAIKEAARTLKEDGVFCLVYSHSSINGWEALVRAYRHSNLIITSVQPLSIERKHRPRAMTSEAVNTCITFVAHKTQSEKKKARIEDLCNKLKGIGTTFISSLKEAGWNDEDIALAVFSNGVAMLANVSDTDTKDNFESLRKIESVVQEFFPTFALKNRKSL